MINNLYEFGGNASIYLKAICDFHNYKKGDIVAFLPDVNVEFQTRVNENIVNKNVNTLMSYYCRDITSFKISSFAMTDNLMSLLNISNNENIQVTHYESHNISQEGTKIYLSYIPYSVKGIQLVPKMEYHYYSMTNSIEIIVPEDNKIDIVNIFITSNEKGMNYELSQDNDLPYLQAEIQLTGNIDKISGNALFNFNKVRLKDKLQFSVEDNTVSNLSLSFDVIKDENNFNRLSLW